MKSNHFADRLTAAIRKTQTPLVVGIDPRVHQLPPTLSVDSNDSPHAIANKVANYSIELIDVVCDLVPAVKPQSAFFELLGPHGMTALGAVIDHAHEKGLLVILDAKRGDIGSTAQAYANAFLGNKPNSAWGSDCLTVNPYLGQDTLVPFVSRANDTGSGLFVLAKTSNPGSGWLQSAVTSGAHPGAAPASSLSTDAQTMTVYQEVAAHLQALALDNLGECGYGNVGAVVGATYPEQLAELRQAMPQVPFLIPGFGAQGGGAADVAPGFDEHGLGAVVNSSRSIIFAYEKPEYSHLPWTDAVRQATIDARDQIASGTNAGKLRPGH